VRRVAAIAAVVVVAVVVIVLVTRGDGDDDRYLVRAIFDNASFAIAGEDVKVAGVNVGTISSTSVTKDKKAAIVLDIAEKGFRDFRNDAHCTVRPQSLIGERFVECTPTAPKKPGQAQAPPLQRIQRGAGKGQLLLPLRNTSTPVDLDQINNILRQPYAQRLSLIINSFGTGLAGNGRELNEAIKRANPALEQTDKVLAALAAQNRQLAQIAQQGDQAIAPLARERERAADFITQANTVAEATASRRGDLERSLALLPPFLEQLRPTVERLGGLSDEMTPVLEDLGAQAPAINSFVTQLGPFSQAARPAFRTLGQAADVGTPAVKEAEPIVDQLDTFAEAAQPVADDLEAILTSLRKTGGPERIMDYAFFQVAAINGFDRLGRSLRAGLVVNLCATYATTPTAGCSANFGGSGEPGGEESTAASRAGRRSPVLERTDQVLRGADPQEVLRKANAQAGEDAGPDRAKTGETAAADTAAGKADGKPTAQDERDRAAAASSPGKGDGAKARARAKAKAKARAAAKRRARARREDQRRGKGPLALPQITLPGGVGSVDPAAPQVQGATPDAAAVPGAGASPAAQPGAGAPANGLLDYLLGG